MRLTSIASCVLVVSSPLYALTPASMTAPEIFESIIEKAEKRSTQFAFEQSTQMMGMTINGSGRGVYQLPKSRTDLTFETPIGNIAVKTISDGNTLWQVEETPMGTKAIRHDISEPLDGTTTPVDPFMAFAGVRTREFLDTILENFDAQVLGVDESATPSVYVLSLEPKGGSEVPTLRLEIGVQDAFPRTMSIFAPDGQPITKMTVTELTFDATPNEAIFTYRPGPNDQVVDAADIMGRDVQKRSGESIMEGRPAPLFTLANLDGEAVSLSSLKGKHVLIDFWATWCPPCKKALPHIQALSEGREGLVVLTVNAEPASVARQFVEQYGYTFTTLVDADHTVSALYGVTAIPTTFIIAPDGTVSKQMVGYHTESQLKQALTSSGL
ncbi:MAG: redoxin domain-containing protein, partial [Candidatus Latescibacterota bacterium]|nr:redoxin domain-containing protein [Candidatus Latescibacterota bacterium]